MDENNVSRLMYEDKEIILIGTAHVSRESAELVRQVIAEGTIGTLIAGTGIIRNLL